jgi:hypothetical protein
MIQIERPGPPAIVAELAPLVALARSFKVNDKDSHAEALEICKRFRQGERGIEDHFARAKKAASDAHKELVRSIAGLVGPIAEARGIIEGTSRAFEKQEEQKAAALQRELQERARKEEEERQLMDAIEAEQAGDSGAAEAILQEQAAAPQTIVEAQVAKVAGASSSKRYAAEIFDPLALVRFVAANPQWLSLLEVDRLAEEHPNLNRLATAQRDGLNFPGVRPIEKTVRLYR